MIPLEPQQNTIMQEKYKTSCNYFLKDLKKGVQRVSKNKQKLEWKHRALLTQKQEENDGGQEQDKRTS